MFAKIVVLSVLLTNLCFVSYGGCSANRFSSNQKEPQNLTKSMDEEFDRLRQRMVSMQLRGRDIRDSRVLKAMGKVPRHEFVPADLKAFAYNDGALPLKMGQTISQPYIVAYMTQLLELEGSERVLEIGTGSGYQAAVLAEIVPEVYTIEILSSIVDRGSPAPAGNQ